MKTQAAFTALALSFVFCAPALASRDLTASGNTAAAGVVVGHLPQASPHAELRHLLSNLGAIECNVFSKATTNVDCRGALPFVACCDSSSCTTNNSGAGGGCPSQFSLGCCPAIDHKPSDCQLVASKTPTCGGDFPVPACCDANTCSVNADASGGSCQKSANGGCCPA